MFDVLRNEDDVARDVNLLNNICVQREAYHNMVLACIRQCNIDKIIECPDCKKLKKEDVLEKYRCEKCNGTGYCVVFKKSK